MCEQKFAVLCDSKVGSFSADLTLIKAEAVRLAKKHGATTHIVEIIGEAVPTTVVDVFVTPSRATDDTGFTPIDRERRKEYGVYID